MFLITLKIYIKLEMTEWTYIQIKNNQCKEWVIQMKELWQTLSSVNCHTTYMCNMNCTKYTKNISRNTKLSAILIILFLGETAENDRHCLPKDFSLK